MQKRRRISGRRFSRYFSGGEKRRPEIHRIPKLRLKVLRGKREVHVSQAKA